MKTKIKVNDFTRIDNDVNGNPRYVLHFLKMVPEGCRNEDIETQYAAAVHLAKAVGGRRYHTAKYGGGIVFQSYNTYDLADKLSGILFEADDMLEYYCNVPVHGHSYKSHTLLPRWQVINSDGRLKTRLSLDGVRHYQS